MKTKTFLLLLLFCSYQLSAQEEKKPEKAFTWWNPASATFRVLEGQGWADGMANFYHRFPARAEQMVPKNVWGLSHHSAGINLRFRSNTSEIKVRYVVKNKKNFGYPHMPATGVSGLDLFAISSDGDWLWTRGGYSFGDTIQYHYTSLIPNDQYHKSGREYRLYLPLYNEVEWMEIGVPEGEIFSPLETRADKPIVVYGTSIAHGACASRPGLAWTSILSRKMDRPTINLAFSGNGQLDKGVIDLMEEIDAKVYVLDCLPNLIGRKTHSAEEVHNRILYAVRALKKRRPEVPIVLASHAGYTEEAINLARRNSYRETNAILDKAFAQLKSEGVNDIFLIPKEDFGQDIETMVDGTHPNDIGMMRYAEGYEKHLRVILKEAVGESITSRPRTQYREPGTYDWELRHREILKQIKTDAPKTVVIGNSITHYWGGSPKAPIARGEASFNKTFGSRGVLNLAYGWDRIENVLWRVHHGELDGYAAKKHPD